MWRLRHDGVFLPAFLGVIGLAWLSLVFWGQSPYSRYLHHDGLAEIRLGRDISLVIVFVSGWTLMTIAMMVPTSLPLITMFRRVTATRRNGSRLVGLLIAGYLVVWTGFGIIAHLLDLGIHLGVARLAILNQYSWAISAAILLVSGLCQFSQLKYRCLDRCRSPRTFIASRWQGGNEERQAFRLGIEHGIFCVGCCWSLMLVLFMVGIGSVFWMLLLGGVMAIEKNAAWGRQMSAPLGVSLVSAGCAISLLAML